MIPKSHCLLLLIRLSKKGLLTRLTKKGKKPNLVEEAITPPTSAKNNIGTVNKTQKSQAYNKIVDPPQSNKTDKFKPIDKSRSTQITDTVNTVDKSRSSPGTNLSNISTRIEKPTEIDIFKDNRNLSGFSLPGYDLSDVTPDILIITCKKRENSRHFGHQKTNYSRTSQPKEKGKKNTLTDVENFSPKKNLHHLVIRYTTKVILMGRLMPTSLTNCRFITQSSVSLDESSKP